MKISKSYIFEIGSNDMWWTSWLWACDLEKEQKEVQDSYDAVSINKGGKAEKGNL